MRSSLRLYLLTWQLAVLTLCAVAVVGLQVARSGMRLAEAQDAALALAVRHLESQLDAAAPPAGTQALALQPTWPAGTPQGLIWRVSSMAGESVAGDTLLAPCPWRGSLRAGAAADLYLTQARSRLWRVAASRHAVKATAQRQGRQGPAADWLVQVALPWSDRLPSAAQVLNAGVRAQLLLLAVLGALAAALAQAASRWLKDLRQVLHAEPGAAAAPTVPAELAPMVDSAREALRSNQQWVDEQREFLADASHQLRTPLAVLRAQLQSLGAPGQPVAESLPTLLRTVDRATYVANQLLGLKKLDQQRRQGQAATVSLWPVCRDAAVELSPLVLAKRLDFELAEFELQIQGEATLLGELVRNLLANAIHHAPQGARMGIVLRSVAQRRELIVWDEGPGIDNSLQPRLFHPFAAAAGGTGLGLSICRQIAQASGATIALFNRLDGGQVVGVDAVVSWGQGP